MEHGNRQPIIPALTGIRAVAAYLVYLHHINPFSPEQFGSFIHRFVQQFHIGVSIFFVLSGFLITLRYYESSTLKRPWLRNYFQNRIARVYPMYFILTSLTALIYFFQRHPHQHLLLDYVMNITFLKGFFDDFKFTLIAQGWSLTVEECFYISAPLLFIGFRRSKSYLIYFTAAFLLSGWLLVGIFSDVNFYGFFKSFTFLFTYTFPGRCVEFFMGAALVILFRPHTLPEEKKKIGLTTFGLLLIMGVVLMMTLLDMNDNAEDYSFEKVVVNNFMLPAGIALFLYGLITESSLLKSILGSSILVTLGKASYSFYLIQIGIFHTLLARFLSGDILLTFILLNFISLVLWYALEEPLNRLIRKI
jgi:peptidoglycan/LPS O-acetylase OafA/YrhL